jgi:putative ABC transport system permease protein
MSDVRGAVRQAVRPWVKRPVFSLTAILTLSTGIAATVAIFSVVDAVLLRPLPWSDPDRLVSVLVARPQWRSNPVLAGSWDRGNVTWVIWQDLQGKSQVFSSVAAWRHARPALDGDRTELVQAMEVSASFFPTLGVSPVIGRFFTTEEDVAASDVAVVSFEAWQRRFGGTPDILGRRITIEGASRSIVGVLPPGFNFDGLTPPEFVLPVGNIPVANRTPGNHFLNAIARMKPGIPLEDATRDSDPHVRGSEKPEEKQARLLPIREQQQAASRLPLWLLLGGAALLLLISCANVAGLLLGDAGSRRHEIAVRAALGGSRTHILRQLLQETLALSVVATIAGLALAWWLTPIMIAMAPTQLPRLASAGIDFRIAAFAVALTALTTFLFGTAPIMALSSADPASALREGGRTEGLGRRRGQRMIVAAEVALAVVLLTTATLLGESFFRLTALPIGFDTRNLVLVSPRLTPQPHATPEQRRQRTDNLVQALAALPGVSGVAATSTAPFSGSGGSNSIEIEGRTFAERPNANRHIVTENYLDVLGIPVLKGRGFASSDLHGGHVALVSQEFERQFMDGEAIGKRFTLNGDVHEIVGVVPVVKHREYDDRAAPAFYAINRQLPQWTTPHYVIRTRSDAAAAIPMIRQAIESAEPRSAITLIETMEAMMARSVAEERFRTQLSAMFGATALLLAALGIYGLIARDVADRRREIGVRMALGADGRRVTTMVLRQAVTLVAVGLAVGVPAAFAGSRLVESLLFGVTAAAPHAFAIVSVVLAAAAICASVIPARRAARVDPVVVMRE